MMLGDNIRKYRELSGYSQSELAGLLGIKKQTLEPVIDSAFMRFVAISCAVCVHLDKK